MEILVVIDTFLALIDEDEHVAFNIHKFEMDAEAEVVAAYLQGLDARTIVNHLWSDEEYVKVRKFLNCFVA